MDVLVPGLLTSTVRLCITQWASCNLYTVPLICYFPFLAIRCSLVVLHRARGTAFVVCGHLIGDFHFVSSSVGCRDPVSRMMQLSSAFTLNPTDFLLAATKHEVWCVPHRKKTAKEKWEAAHEELQQEPAVRRFAARKRRAIESRFDHLVRKQGSKNSAAP